MGLLLGRAGTTGTSSPPQWRSHGFAPDSYADDAARKHARCPRAGFCHGGNRSMSLDLNEFQAHIAATLGPKDERRGISGTFMYFMEEVGVTIQLSANRISTILREFADCLACCPAWPPADIDLAAVTENIPVFVFAVIKPLRLRVNPNSDGDTFNSNHR